MYYIVEENTEGEPVLEINIGKYKEGEIVLEGELDIGKYEEWEIVLEGVLDIGKKREGELVLEGELNIGKDCRRLKTKTSRIAMVEQH